MVTAAAEAGQIERESPSRPASSSRTVARIIIVFVAVLATQNAHICTLCNIRPLGPCQPPPALVADWLKALCGAACPRAAAGLQSTNTAGVATVGLGEEL